MATRTDESQNHNTEESGEEKRKRKDGGVHSMSMELGRNEVGFTNRPVQTKKGERAVMVVMVFLHAGVVQLCLDG